MITPCVSRVGSPSSNLEIRLMRGAHSELGKVDLGPYFREIVSGL